MPTVKEIVNILNHWTGAVQASVEIECAPDAPQSIKIGIAVKVARVHGANLRSANLHGADLRGADLHDANGAKLAIAKTRILTAGSLIGWKKLGNGVVAKLRIPEDARRSHAFGRKCRAEFVDAIEGDGVSQRDGVTKYAPGERVTCDKWCEDWTQECAGGIHFFITREEAEAY